MPRPFRVAMVPVPAPFADEVGGVAVAVWACAYLRCWECNRLLCQSEVDTGAVVFVCFACARHCDVRRVP